jgi:hypothetical protein
VTATDHLPAFLAAVCARLTAGGWLMMIALGSGLELRLGPTTELLLICPH